VDLDAAREHESALDVDETERAVERPRGRLDVVRGQHHGAGAGFRDQPLGDAPAEAFALPPGADVQLGQLEGIGHPAARRVAADRLTDDVVPPLTGTTAIAVTEPGQLTGLVVVVAGAE